MSDPIRLLMALVDAGSIYTNRRLLQRTGSVAILIVVAGVAGTAAVVFAFVAIWFYAVPVVGPANTALIISGILIGICLISVLASRRPALTKSVRGPTVADAEQILASAATLVRKHKPTLLVAAFIAGVLAANTTEDGRSR